MELTRDLISIQGVMESLKKSTGDFTRIKYKGGNEEKIISVSRELQKYLASRKYYMDDAVNPSFKKEVEDILLFLILNTEYKHPLELTDYTHLCGIMPQLSLCLLSNLVVELILGQICADLFDKLPFHCIEEILNEMLTCLKKSHPEIELEYTYSMIRSLIKKISSLVCSREVQEGVEAITVIAAEMLRNLTGLQSDQFKLWKQMQVYQHMGYTLLNLFELLLCSDSEHLLLKNLIDKIIVTCCSIIQNVTIDVFCAWAEIDQDGQTLQTNVSWKAYAIVEKYQKYKPAKQLIQMLSTIARKPKSVSELVREADTPTIIQMVNKITPDQKVWFRALLGTQFLRNEEALKCVDQWAHLADSEDAMLLLQTSNNSDNESAKKLAIKCTSNLSLTDLMPVLARTFYKQGFNYVLNENIHPQLMILFNKLKDNSDNNDTLVHEVILLILQNPTETLTCIYQECLKNMFYVNCLKPIFEAMKNLAAVSHYGVEIFNSVADNCKPNENNVNCYVNLLSVLIEVGYFSNSNVLCDIMFKHLKRAYNDKHYEDCSYLLHVLNNLRITFQLENSTQDFFSLLFTLHGECRCKFLDFSMMNQNVIKEIVTVFGKTTRNSQYQGEFVQTDNLFQQYYMNYLLKDNCDNLLLSLCPNTNFENHAETVSRLIQILPSCIMQEWLTITSQLIQQCGKDKTLEILTDVLMLLCQVMKTQENKPDSEDSFSLQMALGFCLSCYGTVIKDRIQSKTLNTHGNISQDTPQNDESPQNVARNICRLIRELPNAKKEKEGLSLVNLINQDALKQLSNDKAFVSLVVSIRDPIICKVLAQKMMNT